MRPFKLTLIICLSLFSLAVAAKTPTINSARQRAEQLLQHRLLNGNTQLACKTIGPEPCPTDHSGHLFVQYYVLKALQQKIPVDVKQKIINNIDEQRRKPAWRWGYNKSVIVDADDTTYALLTLLMLGETINTSGLDEFYDSKHQAYKSFLNPLNIGPTSQPSAIHNSGIHTDVNANIFYLLQKSHSDKKINYDLLLKQQNQDGSWSGYLYSGRYFPTYLVLQALCTANTGLPEIKRGMGFLYTAQEKNGSWGNAYDTALALNALLTCHSSNHTVIRRGVNYLVQTQNKDGSWQSDNRIWLFTYADSPQTIWYGQDQAGTLTTSLALMALHSATRGDSTQNN